jgi:hypothetical protein
VNASVPGCRKGILEDVDLAPQTPGGGCMTGEMPFWAVRLREERLRRLWSQKIIAARLRDAADEHTRAQLPSIENIKRRVRCHEAGENYPGDLYIELYCRAFGLTREALFGPSPSGSGPASETSVPTEQDALGLATWITASNTSDEAICQIDGARAALAEAHTRLPPGRVLADVLCLHNQVHGLMNGGRQRSRQARELFRIDADLLAHASLLLDDIDHDRAARAHGETAALCAEEAGYSPAFALSAQAKTARWQGVRLCRRDGALYFARSADLARQGFECSPPDAPVRVLLANQEASASALLGDSLRARRALRDAQDAASRLPTGDSGLSTWSCPASRQALYALSVAIRLRDPDRALCAAEMADAAWASGAPWLYGVWSLIRIGAGIAYVMKGDLESAAGQVNAVTTLAPAFRISTITGYLADLASLLGQRRFAGNETASELLGQIAAFTAAASPEMAGSGEER